jgi:esterase/lipase
MKIIKKIFKSLGILLVLAGLVYLFGPSPSTPELNRILPEVTADLAALEQEIIAQESADSIRPGNGAEIIWADPTRKEKTAISIVYIPGFTATKMEGDPIHREFAARYGCNLYLARLEGHGIVTDTPMLNYAPESVMASAKRAMAIAQALGDEVIVMTCSTGGTLAIYLAGGDEKVKALITYSPNVAMARWDTYLLNKPWGLQIARVVFGGDFYSYEDSKENQKYWYTRYRIEALVQLQELLEATMLEENFAMVTQPFFMGYYYKDEVNQDQVVSVAAMHQMYEQLGTPEAIKRSIAFPEAGEHVISSGLKSGCIYELRSETFKFAEEVLGLTPLN